MNTTGTKPCRIAYVIKSMSVGGSQTHLMQVFRLIDRARFAPALFCLGNEGSLLDEVRQLDVPVFTPGAGAAFKGLGLVSRVARLRRGFRTYRPAIVHNYLLRANLAGSMGARLAGVPVVLCSKRGCHERRGMKLLAAKVGNFLADRVTVNANAVRDFVHANEACPLDKMVVIPSGIDTTRFRPRAGGDARGRLGLPTEGLLVGSVTRARAVKGVEDFLRALTVARRERLDVHGVIIGEVTMDGGLRTLVRDLGLDGHLSLLGPRSDMPEVYGALDVLVSSSLGEGMSNAILEAMAVELPVVATGVGGTVEVVNHGHSGLLVPAQDPTALGGAIVAVLADPLRATAMGRVGRKIVEERYSAQAMVRQMEDLYGRLLALRLPATSAEERVAA